MRTSAPTGNNIRFMLDVGLGDPCPFCPCGTFPRIGGIGLTGPRKCGAPGRRALRNRDVACQAFLARGSLRCRYAVFYQRQGQSPCPAESPEPRPPGGHRGQNHREPKCNPASAVAFGRGGARKRAQFSPYRRKRSSAHFATTRWAGGYVIPAPNSQLRVFFPPEFCYTIV